MVDQVQVTLSHLIKFKLTTVPEMTDFERMDDIEKKNIAPGPDIKYIFQLFPKFV